jgi:hypothetical protein
MITDSVHFKTAVATCMKWHSLLDRKQEVFPSVVEFFQAQCATSFPTEYLFYPQNVHPECELKWFRHITKNNITTQFYKDKNIGFVTEKL